MQILCARINFAKKLFRTWRHWERGHSGQLQQTLHLNKKSWVQLKVQWGRICMYCSATREGKKRHKLTRCNNGTSLHHYYYPCKRIICRFLVWLVTLCRFFLFNIVGISYLHFILFIHSFSSVVLYHCYTWSICVVFWFPVSRYGTLYSVHCAPLDIFIALHIRIHDVSLRMQSYHRLIGYVHNSARPNTYFFTEPEHRTVQYFLKPNRTPNTEPLPNTEHLLCNMYTIL